MFTAMAGLNDFRNHGIKQADYASMSLEIQNQLRTLRSNPATDFFKEASLIERLNEIESKRKADANDTALNIGKKTVKVCAGPIAGMAASVVTEVIKKDDESSLTSKVATSVIKTGVNEVQKQVGYSLIGVFSDWIVPAAAVMAAPAIIPAATATAAALYIFSSSVQETVNEAVFNTAKGVSSFASDMTGFVDNKNQKIIDAYQTLASKQAKLSKTTKIQEQKNADLKEAQTKHSQAVLNQEKHQKNLNETALVLKDAKKNFAISKRNLQALQADLKKAQESLSASKKNLKVAKDELALANVEVTKAFQDLQKIENRIQARQNKWFVRFVSRQTGFSKRVFSVVVPYFKKERKRQKNLTQLHLNAKNHLDKQQEDVFSKDSLLNVEKNSYQTQKTELTRARNHLKAFDHEGMEKLKKALDETEKNYFSHKRVHQEKAKEASVATAEFEDLVTQVNEIGARVLLRRHSFIKAENAYLNELGIG